MATMPDHPHRLGRLALNAAVADLDLAAALRPRIEALATTRLPAIVERIFDRLAPGDDVLRIGRLDIDLGTIAPDALEEQSIRAFEDALTEALIGAVHRARHSPSDEARLIDPHRAALDRFEAYLLTGLALNAGGGQPYRPSDAFTALAAANSDDLVSMLRRHAGNPRLLERLVLQLGTAGIGELLALLAPGDAAIMLAIIADTLHAHRIAPDLLRVPFAEPALERLLFVTTIELLLRDAGSQFNRRRFLARLLQREAAASGLDFADLLMLLATAMARTRTRTGFRSSFPVLLAELVAEQGIAVSTSAAARGTMPRDQAEDDRIAALVLAVRGAADDPVTLARLIEDFAPQDFAAIIRAVEPGNADLILAIIDDIVAAHRIASLPPVPAPGIEAVLQSITLRYLTHEAGSQFNRRRFLLALVEGEARHIGIDHHLLLRLLGEALARQETRFGKRGSLPGVLGDLLAELEMAPGADDHGENTDDLAALIAATTTGDPAAAVHRLRRYRHDRAAIAAVVQAMAADRRRAILQALSPDHGGELIATIDAIVALHAQHGLLLRSADALRLMLETIMLQAMLRGKLSLLSGRSLVDLLLAKLAEATATRRETLGERLRDAITAIDPGNDAALQNLAAWTHDHVTARPEAPPPDVLADAIAGRNEARLPDLLQAMRHDRLALRQLAGRLNDRQRLDWLKQIDQHSAAAVSADLDALALLHAAQAVAGIDRATLAALGWALAAEFLLRQQGRPIGRPDWHRHLLGGLAAYLGRRQSQVERELQVRAAMIDAPSPGNRDGLLDALAPSAHSEPSETPAQRSRIEHYLKTGLPLASGIDLPRLHRDDPEALAAIIRRIARNHPAMLAALFDRLLAWLLPEEVLGCLLPDLAPVLMRSPPSDTADGWRRRFAAALRGDPPRLPRRKSHATAARLDRLAQLAHWLDHGRAAWWAPAAMTIERLAADLATYSFAELVWLFGDLADDHRLARLWQAVRQLPAAPRDRLFDRLVPTGAGAGSAAVDDPVWPERIARAIATLTGATVDPDAARTGAAPPPTSPATHAAPERVPPTVDAVQLIDWLDGRAPPPLGRAAMGRLLITMLDLGDRALLDYLERRRSDAAAHQRWAAAVPDSVLPHLVAALAPATAKRLLDLLRLLLAGSRQQGGDAPPRAQLWAKAIGIAAAPESVPLPMAADQLIAVASAVNGDAAAGLRARALRLADRGGLAPIAAALRRADAERAPPPSPRRAAEPGAPLPPPSADPSEPEPTTAEPDHAIYIGNAGLVLAAPYLPVLFDRLGLLSQTDDGKTRIVGLEAQSRAVHLLQYLVDGALDRPEPMLPLNKLLCGLPTAQPVLSEIVASDQDREICEGLLRAMIGNWPIIGNSSIAALRETFLQREGRLLHSDAHWSLQVQRRSLDVLVDQLPWSFATIFHRWMAQPIHVTW